MVKIRIVKIGYLPKNFNQKKLQKFPSEVFDLQHGIQTFHLKEKSDLHDGSWGYSDKLLEAVIPKRTHEDVLLAFTNVSLEQNYYARRLEDNRAIITFHEIKDVLDFHNIPLENFALRMLYEYSLLYLRFKGKIPDISQLTNFTHDETRGCIFDMNGRKGDIYTSCERPIVCYACEKNLKDENVPNEIIENVRTELKGVKKRFFYFISDSIKRYPIVALIVSSCFAIVLGMLGSWFYDLLKGLFTAH